jgi:hypothetical protein
MAGVALIFRSSPAFTSFLGFKSRNSRRDFCDFLIPLFFVDLVAMLFTFFFAVLILPGSQQMAFFAKNYTAFQANSHNETLSVVCRKKTSALRSIYDMISGPPSDG